MLSLLRFIVVLSAEVRVADSQNILLVLSVQYTAALQNLFVSGW